MVRPSVEAVERLYDAFRRRDLPVVMSSFAADAEVAQSTELPWGGCYRGHDEIRQFFGKLGQHLNSSLVVERFIDAGTHVVAVGRTRGTSSATGRSFDVPFAHVWQVREGHVVSFQPYLDNPAMKAAMSTAGGS